MVYHITHDYVCCPVGQVIQLPAPVRVEVQSTRCDYWSIAINSVIACVAVATVVWPKIAEWFIRKYKLIIPSAVRYVYREEAEGGVDTGSVGGVSKNVIYSLPVENSGNVKLNKCEIQTDCVLKRGNDGVSLDAIYKGLPRSFKDESRGATFDLSVNDKAYIRFLMFVPDQMKQSGMTGKEDLKENSPNEGDKKRGDVCKEGHEKDLHKTIIKYSWGIQARGRNTSEEMLKLETDTNVDYFVHVICRAENLRTIYDTWIAIHWSGDAVDNDNLTIRPATKDESTNANAALAKTLERV